MDYREELHRLVDILPESEIIAVKRFAEFIFEQKHNSALRALIFTPQGEEPLTEKEDKYWLDADLGGELPPYEWGPEGPPKGKPVRYVPGTGLVIEGENLHGE